MTRSFRGPASLLESAPPDAGTWPMTWVLLSREVRRLALPIVVLAVLGGAAGGGARALLPQTYVATSEVLIDPRGFQVFKNDLTTGQYDANAAVNYVESQSHVMLSESVLARALSYAAAGQNAAAPAAKPPVTQINALRKSIEITRAERSYILAISVKDKNPDKAASLSNAIVSAYLDEDSDSRLRATEKLTGDLTSRLDQLRARLTESEMKAEQYRQKFKLFSSDDKLIVDQQLSSAVTALAAADERLSLARVRGEQLQSAEPGVIAGFASPSQQTLINTLISRQVMAREEVAKLSQKFGSQHPTLRSAQSQVAEIDSLLNRELERVRGSGQSALRQAMKERDDLSATVSRLTGQNEEARRASIELRALEQQIASDRELLSSFETRAREAAEFGKIDSANIRILSKAYPADIRSGTVGMILWGIVGAMMGALVGFGIAALRALLAYARYTAAANAASKTVAFRPHRAANREEERHAPPLRRHRL